MFLPNKKPILLGAVISSIGALTQLFSNPVVLVQNSPNINGRVEGDIQVLSSNWMNLNSGLEIIGDLYLPGSPSINNNGSNNIGVLQGAGSSSPSNYGVNINSGITLGNIITHTDAVPLPTVSAPASPSGNQWVSLNQGQAFDDWSNLRSLTLNSNYGNINVPAGSYDRFTVNSGASFTLGTPGSVEPTIYNFTHLSINSHAQVYLAGPVILNLKDGFNISDSATLGTSAINEHFALEVRIFQGHSNINSNAEVHGQVLSPNGTLQVNGLLCGGAQLKNLTVNSGGRIVVKDLVPSNTAPVADAQTLTTPEDTALPITLSGSDIDSDTLTYSLLSQPINGTLSGDTPNLVYTPNTDFNGADSFTFIVNDGELDSEVATVNITVTPVNDLPVAESQDLTTPEDTVLPITLSGSDVDSDALTYSLLSQPINGTLSGDIPNLVYTPNTDFNGTDSFTFIVNDGELDSEVATVNITVTPVNDLPLAEDVVVNITSNDSVSFALVGSDLETPQEDLQYLFFTDPSIASFSGDAPILTANRINDLAASEIIYYRVFDGEDFSAPAKVTINVTAQGFLEVDAGIDANYTFNEVYKGGEFTPASGGTSQSLGKNFLVCFPFSFDKPDEIHKLLISSETNANVKISTNLGLLGEIEIIGGEITEFIVPSEYQLSGEPFEYEEKGIYIESNVDISVYGINLVEFLSEAYLALPDFVAGTEYYVATYQNMQVNALRPSSASVVALLDDTEIQITPKARVRIWDGSIVNIGETYTVKLNKGQVHQFESNVDRLSDLTGSHIVSNNPINVFGAHECVFIPVGVYACDHIVEQLPPVNNWGNEFLTAPLATRTAGDIFRIMSSESGNQITINGSVVATLGAGDFYELDSGTPNQISTSSPALLTQFSKGQNADGVVSDPAMMVIPSIEQYANKYIVQNEEFNFDYSFINVTGNELALQDIILDGQPIDQALILEIGTSGFFYAQIPVSFGSHTIESSLPFGCFVYAFGNFDSYAYAGGMNIPFESDESSDVVVSDLSGTLSANELTQFDTADITVLVSDADGNPVPNAEVQIIITGVQELSRAVKSDSQGYAYYSFQGISHGVTDIAIISGAASEQLSVSWLPKWFELSGQVSSSQAVNSATWSESGNPGLVVMEDTSALQTRFYVSQPGTYTFDLSADDGSLATTDSVTYEIQSIPEVIIDAGDDQSILLGEEISLTGSVLVNQEIDLSSLVTTWTLIEGNETAIVTDQGLLETSVSLTEAGTYTFELSSNLSENTDTVQVTVTDFPDTYFYPEAFDRSYTVTEENSKSMRLLASVAPDYTAEYLLTTAPQHGTLSGVAPFLTYTPDVGYLGLDEFSYQVFDGENYSTVATVNINVLDRALTPELFGTPPLDFIVAENSTTTNTSPIFSYQFNAVDPEGDPIWYLLLDSPEGAQIGEFTGAMTWDTTDFPEGLYSYTVKVHDNRFNFDQETYEINLVRNNSPVFLGETFSVSPGQTLTVTDLIQDEDLGSVILTATSSDTNGVFTTIGTGFEFVPNIALGSSAMETVTLTVTDGVNQPVTQDVKIFILPADNTAPLVSFSLPTETVDISFGNGITQLPEVSDDYLTEDELIYSWEVIESSGGITLVTPNEKQSDLIISELGSYTLQLTVSDGILSNTATYDVNAEASTNTPPQITITDSLSVDLQVSDTLNINPIISDDGLILGSDLVVNWTQTAGYPVRIDTADDYSAEIQFFSTGEYVFELTANDGQFTATTTLTIPVSSTSSSILSISAGVDQVLGALGSASLNATVESDLNYATTWTLVEGPAGASITSPNSDITEVSFTEYGSYRFRLSIDNGRLIATDEVIISVLNDSLDTVLNAGEDITVVLGDTLTFDLNGNVEGEVLPTEWVMLAGFEGTEIVDVNSLTSEVIPSFPGEYVFALRAVDNASISFDTVTVTVQSAPFLFLDTPTAGSQILENTGFSVSLQAFDSVGNVTSVEVFIDGVKVGDATQVFNDTFTYNVTNGLPRGEYTLSARATNTSGLTAMTDEISFLTYEAGNPPPPSLVSQLTFTDIVEAPTPVIVDAYGTSFESYNVSYREKGANEWIELFTSTTQALEQPVTTFSPSLLRNGTYEMALTTTGSGTILVDSLEFIIDSDLKIGHFALAFEDLSVPITGVPISITRAYDSRNQKVGDFGKGWELGLQSIEVRKTGILGENWNQQRGGSFIPQYQLSYSGNAKVTVRLGGGEMATFTPAVIGGGSSTLIPLLYGQLGFEPEGDTKGSLSIAGNSFFLYNSTSGDLSDPVSFGNLLDQFTAEPFNPSNFIYTDEAGNEYRISVENGLFGVTDINDNTLTFTDDGIIHSSGESISYTRNADGLITTITDPAGLQIHYRYNGNQLIEFENREGEVTSFHYEEPRFPNYLTRIVDPAGNDAIRTEYDEDGRLVSQTDALGHEIGFIHDTDNNTEVITDRLGRTTTHRYNDLGYITETTDALGGVTSYTYDEYGNETSVTTPEGVITYMDYDRIGNVLSEQNALGETTTYNYNSRSNPTTISDALGHETSLAYSFNGNLTSMADAEGNVTSFGYSSSGNLASLTDAEGTVTSYIHDSLGREQSMTVIANDGTPLRSESYTYDTNGNRLTSTTTRTLADGTQETLITTNTYDGENRLTGTTYPDGTSTSSTYNLIGKQASTTDQLGRVTTFEYDARGNLILTTYPDSTTSQTIYDLENQVIATVDQIGVARYTLYDALGRQTHSIIPDESMPATVLTTSSEILTSLASGALSDNPVTITEYDGDGRVIANIDALGNRMEYEYDAVGRRTVTRDALGRETTTAYNANGQQTSVTDALGRTTSFQYDDNNRLTLTTFHDDTTTSTEYDDLGRRIASIDQEGNRTQFEYDSLGRMVAVIDALNQRTEYAYNEVGNMLVQRDALGRETAYEYDTLGRRTARILPEGQRESMTYNTLGNMLTRTDFNGYTTSYAYEALTSRLASITADPSHPSHSLAHAPAQFEYTYDDLGRRLTSTSKRSSGATLYQRSWGYNNRGELTQADTGNGVINYVYDANGNLSGTMTDTLDGYDQSFDYDSLNRLSDVYIGQEGIDPLAYGLASYAYNEVGSLSSVAYANQVAHVYDYTDLNRLSSLQVGKLAIGVDPPTLGNVQQSYTYTLNNAGHSTQILEHSGRTLDYVYDELYRLTSETISSAPSGLNGTISYTHDAVGNRLSRTSTVTGVTSQSFSYSGNDHLTTDTHDANGNTLSSTLGHNAEHSGAYSDIYDFRNKLLQRTYTNGVVIQLSYDADGNRVSKNVIDGADSRQHNYLVDTNNHTGYAQVIEETDAAGDLIRVNNYGHDLIRTFYLDEGYHRYYHYDGLGSVHALSDVNGDLTDEYEYDAFGILLNSTGTTPNQYLYTGEQWDADLGMYFLRARYNNVQTGRFHNMDTYEGRNGEPLTLHKYLYGHGNPVSNIDPSGNISLVQMSAVSAGIGALGGIALNHIQGKPLFSPLAIIKGALFGAVVGPFAYAYPVVGGVLGIYGVGATGKLSFDTLTNPNATLSQKTLSVALVVASIWGAKASLNNMGKTFGTPIKAPKFPLPFFVRLPGGIGLRSMQSGLRADKIHQIPGLIRTMRDGGSVPKIAGFKDGNTYYINEGNHRMAAALELFRVTKDSSYVTNLLQNGVWSAGKPTTSTPMTF